MEYVRGHFPPWPVLNSKLSDVVMVLYSSFIARLTVSSHSPLLFFAHATGVLYILHLHINISYIINEQEEYIFFVSAQHIELIRLFVTFGTLFVYSSSRHEF